MKKINLTLIIILTLCIGWSIGFYIGIPKHITVDIKTPKSLKEDITNALNKMHNITKDMPSCSYYNVTNYMYNGYTDYARLLAEVKTCNNNREYIWIKKYIVSIHFVSYFSFFFFL